MKRIRKFSTDFISILVIFAMLFCVFPLSANASDIKGDINHNGVLDSRDALLIQRCCIGLIKLTDEEKQQIMAWLKEARELAIDAESSKKKHEVFGKYKGRINN